MWGELRESPLGVVFCLLCVNMYLYENDKVTQIKKRR